MEQNVVYARLMRVVTIEQKEVEFKKHIYITRDRFVYIQTHDLVIHNTYLISGKCVYPAICIRNTLGILDQYICSGLRLWNNRDCETV